MTQPRGGFPPLILTVDVEDYFQVSGFENIVPRPSWGSFESRVERNTQRLLELLQATGSSATFFVLGWTAARFPSLVRAIGDLGHEVACHSYEHQLIYRSSPEAFREDTRQAKMAIEDAIGSPLQGYRAPSFSITRQSLWALDILAGEGFRYDSSIFPIFRDRYGIPGAPRFPYWIPLASDAHAGHRAAEVETAGPGSQSPGGSILEIPPATICAGGITFPLGGGGYLRIFPEAFFRWAVDRVIRVEQQSVVLYVHPWELDPQQPRMRSGSPASRFRHYVNLDKTEGRLRRLLAAHPSVTIASALPRLASRASRWNPTPP